MAYGPPSYHAASYRQLWIIVAPYIHSEDLYSACVVSREWNQIFTSYLWGSPASHFGSDNDTIYLSLTRFKRLLTLARRQIRSLVHTLHIPPAHPELYDGPSSGWLRDVLDRLPSLQSLIASNLSYFDHPSLHVLHQNSTLTYPLRLLDVSKCDNTTASSLALALPHFPELIYLDLSAAQGSRSPAVLGCIAGLPELVVLRLKSSGLRDEDVEVLAFSKRLRSLDISNNLLTEHGIGNILERIPAAPVHRSPSSPFARRYSGIPLPVKVVDGGVDKYVRQKLTSCVDGHLQIEEGLPNTFSHLYVASNNVTVDSLAKVLSQRSGLQYIDCGGLQLSRETTGSLSTIESQSMQLLSSGLFVHAFRNLRVLTIHHSVVTGNPFSGTGKWTDQQIFELHSEDLRYELDSAEVYSPGQCFELDGAAIHEVPAYSEKEEDVSEKPEQSRKKLITFETPDDVGSSIVTLPSATKSKGTPQEPTSSETNQPLVSSLTPLFQHTTPVRDDLAALPSATMSQASSSYHFPGKGKQPAAQTSFSPDSSKDILTIINSHRQQLSARERPPGRFQPSLLPNLRTLTLTNLPATTRNKAVTETITTFIQECAEEEELGHLTALLSKSDLAHDRCRSNSSIPAVTRLQRIILEFEQSHGILPPSLSLDPTAETKAHRHAFTKSSTGDADSEIFMQESSQDFSFFKEDDGGLLVSKGRLERPVAKPEGMVVRGREDSWDVLGEVAGWRRERKRMWEDLGRKAGGIGLEEKVLCGHWRGEVKVVRLAG